MPRASPIQYAFNGGQLGPRLQGRSDLARYATGCNKLQNFIPSYQGPAIKRSGFRHVKPVKDSTKKTRLIPFEFSRTDAYMVELGEGYLRVYKDSASVLETAQSFTAAPTAANPVVCTDTSHPFSNGDLIYITGSAMTELNGRFFTVANAATNTYELSGENGTGRTTGTGGTAARVYEIEDGVSSNSLPWLEADLFQIQFVQSADVLYLAHPDHPPHKIERTSDTAWTCSEITFDYPPFSEENLTDTTVYVSATTGTTITLTASAALFTSSMVGSYFKIIEEPAENWPKWGSGRGAGAWGIPGGGIAVGDRCYWEDSVYRLTATTGTTTGFDPPVHEEGSRTDKSWTWAFENHGYGYAKITAYTSSTVVTVDVDTDGVRFPASVVGSGNATDRWAFSAFGPVRKYPAAVGFYEDRLWWGGTEADPQTFWGSRTGEYEDHRIVGSLADSALVFTLASDKINAIEWMSGEDTLLIGTRGGEFTADSGSASEAITPDNIRVRRRSNYGSATGIQPLFVDSALLFVQRSKNRVHELVYTNEADRYVAPDLTQLSSDILEPGVVQLSYQSSPLRLLWALLSDGSLASMTYVKDQDVLGWAKHLVGGTDAFVESVASIPHPDGDADQLWAIVKRTVDGGTVRHVEFMEKLFDTEDAIEDAFFVDAGLTYSGAATTSVTGIDHLEGETVQILADGLVIADQVVTGGAITLETEATKVHVGLAMPAAQLQTMEFDAGAADGTAIGRKKRIHQVSIKLHITGEGVKYGPDFDTMDEWFTRDAADLMDTPLDLFTGTIPSQTMPGAWSREARVAVSHAFPLPCTVVAIMPQMSTEQR